jgi:hypothetical protein
MVPAGKVEALARQARVPLSRLPRSHPKRLSRLVEAVERSGAARAGELPSSFTAHRVGAQSGSTILNGAGTVTLARPSAWWPSSSWPRQGAVLQPARRAARIDPIAALRQE